MFHMLGVIIYFVYKYCFAIQEVRYLSSKMGHVKVLLSRIYMVLVITLLPQCIPFRISQIVWSSLTSALTLNSFQRILVDVQTPGPWLKFLIMDLTVVSKMVYPMRSNISQWLFYQVSLELDSWSEFSILFMIFSYY